MTKNIQTEKLNAAIDMLIESDAVYWTGKFGQKFR